MLAPVIAIMSHPLNSTHEFIPASYVKYLEMGGARATRIPFEAEGETLEGIFENTNGLLFMGGEPSLPASAVEYFDIVMDAVDNGDFYPIWGTCLGFEWLSQLVSGDKDVLDKFDAENITLPLNLTGYAAESRLFSPPDVSYGTIDTLKLSSDYPITLNTHTQGVLPEKFQQPPLSDFFNVLSTNVDRQGIEFVSTIESKDPSRAVYGTQWHPEKNAFEYGTDNEDDAYIVTKHTPEALTLTFEFSKFFVGEARKSQHTFDPDSGVLIIRDEANGFMVGESFEERYIFEV